MKNFYNNFFIEADLHTHSIISNHASSTLNEHIKRIKDLNMKGLALTNHGPLYEDGGNIAYFSALRNLPDKIDGIDFYSGAEADIIDYDGKVDIDNVTLAGLKWVIASIHTNCLKRNSQALITASYIGAISNPYIHCLGHIGQTYYECDFEKVVKAAKEHNKVIEINNSSLKGLRPGSRELCYKVARLCKTYDVKVCVVSDAHSHNETGIFNYAKSLLEDAMFPYELIINRKNDEFKDFLKTIN